MTADIFQYALGGGARIGMVRDGATDDNEVGAVAYGVCRCGYPFLITLFGPRRTNAGCEDDEPLRGNTLADQANLMR